MNNNGEFNGERKVLFSIFYRGFGPVNVAAYEGEAEWFFDKDYPGNVCHHIMSLRWLHEVDKGEDVKDIVRSFIIYHNMVDLPKSIYYLGKAADHTASIRLGMLVDVYERYSRDGEFSRIAEVEISKTVDSCLLDTYKNNNNHGLMVDKSLLECMLKSRFLLKKYEGMIEFLLDRVSSQLDGMFDVRGYSKEHSISYQEHNMGLAKDLFCTLDKVKSIGRGRNVDLLKEKIATIEEASKKSLGWLLKDDGLYIPIGDSSGVPKGKILRKSFGKENPMEALQPYSKEEGVFHNKTLGVSVFRNEKVMLSMNSCWHSFIHKQNDDLHIFLRINGEDLFVDGGFSSVIQRKNIDRKSEYLHSTVIPIGKKWLDPGKVNEGWSRSYNIRERGGDPSVLVFCGEHTRVKGHDITRKVTLDISRSKILISDFITPPIECRHRFLIPKTFSISVDGSRVRIYSKLNSVTMSINAVSRFSEEVAPWEVSFVDSILDDRKSKLYALDFFSNGHSELVLDF